MTKKSNRTIDKIITPVNCQYGAPHGRRGVLPPEYVITAINKKRFVCTSGRAREAKRLFDCKIPMRGGYDRGGAYWGLPDNVRVKYTKDLSYIEFYRPGK